MVATLLSIEQIARCLVIYHRIIIRFFRRTERYALSALLP